MTLFCGSSSNVSGIFGLVQASDCRDEEMMSDLVVQKLRVCACGLKGVTVRFPSSTVNNGIKWMGMTVLLMLMDIICRMVEMSVDFTLIFATVKTD